MDKDKNENTHSTAAGASHPQVSGRWTNDDDDDGGGDNRGTEEMDGDYDDDDYDDGVGDVERTVLDMALHIAH